ncbi:MAG: hypothetical protein O2904_02000 [bacterium]|nr:hypothetical protein [bacterium]
MGTDPIGGPSQPSGNTPNDTVNREWGISQEIYDAEVAILDTEERRAVNHLLRLKPQVVANILLDTDNTMREAIANLPRYCREQIVLLIPNSTANLSLVEIRDLSLNPLIASIAGFQMVMEELLRRKSNAERNAENDDDDGHEGEFSKLV